MILYNQWFKEIEVSDTEFVQYARRVYSYDVPTFRQALRDLIRSFTRTRLINKAIPDVQAAYDYLHKNGSIGSTYHDGIKLDETCDY
jgi:hypothetical protein